MARTTTEPAVKVSLSVQSTAVIYGVGKTWIERGGRVEHFNEREMRVLVEAWAEYDLHRRNPATSQDAS